MNNQRTDVLKKMLNIVLYATLTLFLLIFLHSIIRDVDYGLLLRIPREYREAANLEMEQYILEGKNPYAVSNLDEDVPGPFYDYPLLYCYTVAFLARIVDIDLLTLNYVFSLLCIVLSGVIIAMIVWQKTKCSWYSILACILGINCHWRGGYVAAHPDDMALLLLTILLFIVMKKHSGKEFITAFLVVLLFYTKQYFIVLVVPLFLYFASQSKKRMLYFCGYGIALGAISILIVTNFFPLYWMYAICNVFGYVDFTTWDNLLYSIGQYKSFGVLFICQFVPIIIYILLSVSELIRQKKRVVWNFKNMEKPLFDICGDLYMNFIWFGFWCMGIFLLYFGLNKGAFGTYFLQMWGPFVIILGAVTTMKIADRFRNKIGDFPYFIGAFMIIFINLFFIVSKMDVIRIDAAVLSKWNRAYSIVDETEGEKYYSPLLAIKGFDNKDYVYNTGMAPVNHLNEDSNPATLKYFPEYGHALNAQHIGFQKSIKEMVAGGEYALITKVTGMEDVFSIELLSQKYEIQETIELPCGNHIWNLEFWVLK